MRKINSIFSVSIERLEEKDFSQGEDTKAICFEYSFWSENQWYQKFKFYVEV